ncbi:MAG TPA: hypothetical protein VEG28_05370 [Dehalococcoidia bacterium]|nr:hypothetical protein [Dehalococcoidia bacterium]
MTTVLPRPEYRSDTCDFIYELRNDPKVIEFIKLSMKAQREGRVKPWSKVKEELGIR